MMTRKEMIAHYEAEHGRPPNPEEWKAYVAEKERLTALAKEKQTLVSLEGTDGMKYMQMGLGVSPGQAGTISGAVNAGHSSDAVIHVGVSSNGKVLHIAVEATPDVTIKTHRTVRRRSIRFYDFYRHVKAEHDNVIRDEGEWPVIEELIEFPEGSGQWHPASELAAAVKQAQEAIL